MKTIKNLMGLWKLYRTLQKISNAGHYHLKLTIYAKDILVGPATHLPSELNTSIKLDL